MGNKPEDALAARLSKLTPTQREALLKKLKQQKSEKPEPTRQLRDQPIPHVARDAKEYPLSYAQQRLWFLDRLDQGSAAYNIAAALQLQGNLDTNRLNQTFQRIIQRHESLRTIFFDTKNGVYQQVIEKLEWELPVIDLTSCSEQIDDYIHQEANTGFNLEAAPLFRARLFKLDKSEYVLTLVMHHIISDAWSSQILLSEVSRTYSALAQNTPLALPTLKVHYIDYAIWQREYLAEGYAKKQLHYWKNKLKDYANLNLSTDKPRPALLTQNGAFHRITLKKEKALALQQLCLQQGTTLFNGLLSVFEVLLHRYTQQTDFCIGTPVAGRIHPDIELLIGFFVNSLALKCDALPNDSFKSLLRKIKKTTIEAQSNQDIPFEQLVDSIHTERDGSYSPIFQVFFSYNPGIADQQIKLPKINTRFIPADTETSKFEISLIISDQDDGLSCHFEYNTDLFVASTIEMMAEHFTTLVTELCRRPETPLHAITMLNQAEYESLSNRFYSENFPDDDIATLFEKQVLQTPDKLAVKQGDNIVSFKQLNQQSNQLAHYLINNGVQQGDFIGLCFPPSIDLTIALLASIKIGAAYVPMDPAYPAERLSHIVENADIKFLLSVERVDCHKIQVAHHLNIDQLDLSTQATTNPPRNIQPNDALYVIYTSGSTGIPKAAIVTHRGEANLLHWYTHNYQLSANDKILVFSAIGFDLTQKNLFAALCFGAELHFGEAEFYEPETLLNCISNNKISWINCAPSAFYPLLDSSNDFSQLSSLTKLFFGGENINLENFAEWIASEHFHAKITNMYGPTECTDIAASYTLADASNHRGSIPIGTPCANTSLYVLDEYLNFLPKGAVGELYIGGAGVGKGYLNNPEMTAARFIKSPFNANDILYRTGDLVRYCYNNYLEFIARTDDQIKIRGFRIELGEIEANLRHIKNIEDAVVTAREINGQKQLLAFIISNSELLPFNTYKRELKQYLPDYMVPIAYLPIDKIPLTPNGKVDRKKLPDIDLSLLKQTEYIAPRNQNEAELALIWQSLLHIERIGIQDNFFELGGHSLLATQLLTRMRDKFELELPLRTIFEVNTIEGLAEIISVMTSGVADDNVDNDEAFEEGIL